MGGPWVGVIDVLLASTLRPKAMSRAVIGIRRVVHRFHVMRFGGKRALAAPSECAAGIPGLGAHVRELPFGPA